MTQIWYCGYTGFFSLNSPYGRVKNLKEVKMNKKWFVIVMCAAMLVCITVVPSRAANPGINPPGEIGPYLVGYTNLMLVDHSRYLGIGGRPIAVDVFYPADPYNQGQPLLPAQYVVDPYGQFGLNNFGWPTIPSTIWEVYGLDPVYQTVAPSPDGPFPLLVFSPGYGAPSFAYIYVGARLASHGFVVAILSDYGDYSGEHIAQTALNRTIDVSFMITDLLARDVDPDDLLYGMIQEDQIAMSGHSLGGYATLALAGGDAIVCDTFMYPDYLPPPETCVLVQPDARIKAIVTLDGSNERLHFSELAQITLPAMGIGEEWSTLAWDPVFLGGASWQARQHAAMQGHPNYRVDVAGAQHLTFTIWCEIVEVYHDIGWVDDEFYTANRCSQEPIPQAEVERLTTMYMVAFLKDNLVGEHGYQPYLTPGYAQVNEPNIEFFVTEKRNPHAIDEDWPDDFIYFPHQPGSEQAIGPKNPQGLIENRMSNFLLP
jgi:predicted dienelactone hydrolase